MVIVTVGLLIFWTGLAAWLGARLALRAGSQTRCGGAALLLTGVGGFLYGMRLLAS